VEHELIRTLELLSSTPLFGEFVMLTIHFFNRYCFLSPLVIALSVFL
jgi:hypothetical protein